MVTQAQRPMPCPSQLELVKKAIKGDAVLQNGSDESGSRLNTLQGRGFPRVPRYFYFINVGLESCTNTVVGRVVGHPVLFHPDLSLVGIHNKAPVTPDLQFPDGKEQLLRSKRLERHCP